MLHPFVQKMIDSARETGRPAFSSGTPQQARDLVTSTRASVGVGPDVGDVTAVTVPTRSGSVPARLYRSRNRERGLIVYLHGGGWVLGALDDFDITARDLVHHSDCAVLLVDYRLAPEHPFPAGLEDAEDAIAWVAASMPTLVGRRLPLVVAGDSAGGNLTTVALAGLRGKVDCALQLLFYPVTDSDIDRPSYHAYGEGLPLTRADMQWFFEHYAPQTPWGDSRISPIRCTDLAGSPPAWIVTAEYDVLRDEGEDYASALRKAGVPANLRRIDGLAHGFIRLSNLVDVVEDVLKDAGDAIKLHCDAHRVARAS